MLAENVHNLRRERRLSLQQLAHKAGVSRTTLWQLEQGRANPSIKIVQKLAEAMSVSIFDLTGWEISLPDSRSFIKKWAKERDDVFRFQNGDAEALSQINFRNWQPSSFEDLDILFLLLSKMREVEILEGFK